MEHRFDDEKPIILRTLLRVQGHTGKNARRQGEHGAKIWAISLRKVMVNKRLGVKKNSNGKNGKKNLKAQRSRPAKVNTLFKTRKHIRDLCSIVVSKDYTIYQRLC